MNRPIASAAFCAALLLTAAAPALAADGDVPVAFSAGSVTLHADPDCFATKQTVAAGKLPPLTRDPAVPASGGCLTLKDASGVRYYVLEAALSARKGPCQSGLRMAERPKATATAGSQGAACNN